VNSLARDRGEPVVVRQLKFAGVLDRHHLRSRRDEHRDGVHAGRLPRCGAACEEQALVVFDREPEVGQLFDVERAVLEQIDRRERFVSVLPDRKGRATRRHLLAQREFGPGAVGQGRLDHRVANGDVSAGVLGQSDDEPIERGLRRRRSSRCRYTRRGRRRGQLVAVTGDILDVRIVHDRVELAVPPKSRYEIKQAVERRRVDLRPVALQKFWIVSRAATRRRRSFSAVQQRIADVFEQRLEQDRLLIAERRFDGPVPVFAGVVVVADRDERKRRVDPVAVDLPRAPGGSNVTSGP